MADMIPAEYKTAEGLRTLANYLRSQNGVKVRQGVEIEKQKRVDYFKGKRLVECVLEAKKWPKSIPKITDRGIACLVANLLIQGQFFHRSEKVDGKKGYLKIMAKNVFEDSGYYTWIYAGNMVWSNIATGAVIAVVIGFTLLPIWPDVAKKVLWYLSVTLLIAILAFCLVRFVLFLIMWIFGYEFWIFPRLFDESLSFQDSFKPFYCFEKGTPGQGYYRIGVIALLIGFVYWACTQPTEFDGFIKAQRDFIDDIYSGNLLSDVSQESRDNIDRARRGSVPNIEDLLREMEEEERIDASPHHDPLKDFESHEEDVSGDYFGEKKDSERSGGGSGGGGSNAQRQQEEDREEAQHEEDMDKFFDEILTADE